MTEQGDPADGQFNVARCPTHGLHGLREECFVCGGPVEQVPVVPLERAHRAEEAARDFAGIIDSVAEGFERTAKQAPFEVRRLYLGPAKRLRQVLAVHPGFLPNQPEGESRDG